jgi:REP element-mobilizing transposase RayT
MQRPLRIEYAGAIYHAMSRGNRREAIFLDDGDRHDFLKTLGDACAKTDFAVHAYCMIKNHYCQTARLEKGPSMSTHGKSYG